jgi:hypothetical protein
MTLKGIFWIIFRSPKKACLPVIYMSVSGDYEGLTNRYQHMFKVKDMDPKVYDAQEGKRLWESSISLWKEADPGAKVFDGS